MSDIDNMRLDRDQWRELARLEAEASDALRAELAAAEAKAEGLAKALERINRGTTLLEAREIAATTLAAYRTDKENDDGR